jgi:chromosome segregation ATPase
MIRNAVALVLFAVSSGVCQTSEKPDVIQSLLAEVHQLRQDIEAMTVASQRVQIALYSLQMQDAAVARETLRFDGIHNKCSVAESERQKLASDAQAEETELASGTLSPDRAKQAQAILSELKHQVESKSAEAQSCQATEAEASSRLRSEQATLSNLQERIQRLDKALEKLGGDK